MVKRLGIARRRVSRKKPVEDIGANTFNIDKVKPVRPINIVPQEQPAYPHNVKLISQDPSKVGVNPNTLQRDTALDQRLNRRGTNGAISQDPSRVGVNPNTLQRDTALDQRLNRRGTNGAISQDPSKVGVNPNTKVVDNEAVAQPVTRPVTQFRGATDTPDEALGLLKKQELKLETEISDLGKTLANIPTATLEAQKRLGIQDDQAQLADMRKNLSIVKQQLLEAQDEEIAISERGRQKISDFAGTGGDFGQLTNQGKRDNRLDQLTASRTYSRLGDAVGNFQASINDNIALIRENAKAEQAKLEFDISEKNKILDRVLTTQGNILTAKQKKALEDQKFKQQLVLQDKTAQNAQKKAILAEALKSGRYSIADIGEFYDMSFPEIIMRTTQDSPANQKNWLEYTEEEAITQLDTEQYKRWKGYNGLDAISKKERAKQEALVVSTNNMISLVDDIIDNEGGLGDSVGIGLGRLNLLPFNSGEVNRFRTDLTSLASIISLDTLSNLKASGATLGAISEKELKILQTANTRLGLVLDDDGNVVGRSSLPENDFKKRLREIQAASIKVNVLNELGRSAFDSYGLKNKSDKALRIFYNDMKAGKLPTMKRSAIIDTGIPNVYGGTVKSSFDFAKKIGTAQNILNLMGIKLKIGDSFRSNEVQKTAFESGKKGVAPPGTSFHEKGEAIDLSQRGVDNMNNEEVFTALRNAGLQQHPNEWWHWSINEFA